MKLVLIFDFKELEKLRLKQKARRPVYNPFADIIILSNIWLTDGVNFEIWFEKLEILENDFVVFNVAKPGVGHVQVLGSKKFLRDP